MSVCISLGHLSTSAFIILRNFLEKKHGSLFQRPTVKFIRNERVAYNSIILHDNFSLINVFLQKISPQISEAVPGNWYVSQKLMIPMKVKWETVPEMPSMQ